MNYIELITIADIFYPKDIFESNYINFTIFLFLLVVILYK